METPNQNTESFTTSSGKEITVFISDAGEPERVSWIGDSTLSENELLEIAEYVEDYGSEDDDSDDDDESSPTENSSHELT